MNIVTLILNNGSTLALMYSSPSVFHEQRRNTTVIDDRTYYELTDDNGCFVTVDVKCVALLGIQPQPNHETPYPTDMGGAATVN